MAGTAPADDEGSWTSSVWSSITGGVNWLVNTAKVDSAALLGSASAVGDGIVTDVQNFPSDVGNAVVSAAGKAGQAAGALLTPINKTLLIVVVGIIAVAAIVIFWELK